MTPTTLAIGRYDASDAAALRAELQARLLPDLAALAALPEAERRGVRALAYKGHDPLGAAEMALLPALQVIANYGVGFDAIDVAAADARRVVVTNTPDVLSEDVADLAVALILAQSRGLVEGARHVAGGGWARGEPLALGRKVSGARAGILGLGRIGREIADRLAALRMPIHYWSRSPKKAPEGWTAHSTPSELAAQSDFLVVALVGGASTQGFVSAEVIAALPETAVVVNISRGSTLDEAALIAALEAGRLGGAALDVMLNEPEPDPRLVSLPNVLLSPHIGSATVETRAEMADLQRRNIAAVLAGRTPPTPINGGFATAGP